MQILEIKLKVFIYLTTETQTTIVKHTLELVLFRW